jgi:hypothetical protein
MVNNRLENKGVIPEQQYGFRRNTFTTDVHIILESNIQEAFRKKQNFVLVSLDLAKAYDTCWRRHIVKTLSEKIIRGNLLRFVHSFMENRSFRVVLGERSSEKTYNENGVIQRPVITLFLLALKNIVRQVQDPVEIIWYADDWVIDTSDQNMYIAQANIQAALNNVSSWTRRKGYKISPKKTVAIHRKRIHNHRDPDIRLNEHRLEIKNTQKILGLTFDNRITWNTHIDEVRANESKRMNLLKCLAGINWEADQEIMFLSALEFGSATYGLAKEGKLKRLEPIHNKGQRIAIGAFCVCRTENILCESGFESLAERRGRKPINTAIHVVENESHPVNNWFSEEEAFDNYALNMKLTKPFFIRALEAC